MLRKLQIVLVFILLAVLINSCGNKKESLVDKACQEMESAWILQGAYLKPEIEKKSNYYKSASEIFRELASIDSGFASYASAANEAAKGIYGAELLEVANFCGLKS